MRRLRCWQLHAVCQHDNLWDDAVLHDVLQVVQRVVEADVTRKTDGEERPVIAVTIRQTVGRRQSHEHVTEVGDVDVVSDGADCNCNGKKA